MEWKFTESYAKPLNPISSFGTDRREIYRGLVESDWSPIDRAAPLDAFFHEPYYQLLRLHLLAASMHAWVPTGLRGFGSSLTEVWQRLVPDKIVSFRSVDSKHLLSASESLAERYG